MKLPDLANMNAAQLLEQLRSPERWIRYQAKRLLFHRSEQEVIKACDEHGVAMVFTGERHFRH